MATRQTSAPPPLTDEQFHAITRALADPRRFAMFEQVAMQESMTCSGLDAHQDISPATISHHLKELTEAGLIIAQREGRMVRLSLRRNIWNAYRRRLASL